MHPLGVVFITPQGLVSNYLAGVGYQPEDVRGAVRQAAAGEIIRTASLVTLLCYEFDATTGQYTLAIVRLLCVAAALTVLILAVGLWRALRYEGRGA
jgi:protein SCO1/2